MRWRQASSACSTPSPARWRSNVARSASVRSAGSRRPPSGSPIADLHGSPSTASTPPKYSAPPPPQLKAENDGPAGRLHACPASPVAVEIAPRGRKQMPTVMESAAGGDRRATGWLTLRDLDAVQAWDAAHGSRRVKPFPAPPPRRLPDRPGGHRASISFQQSLDPGRAEAAALHAAPGDPTACST